MSRYISALRKRGFGIRLTDDGKRMRIKPKLPEHLYRQVVAAREIIIRELLAEQPMVSSRWADVPGQPPHNTDALVEVHAALFAECARLGWKAEQFHEQGPAPDRPYCYVRENLVDGRWHYWPMLADADGVDYVWEDAQK